MQQHRWFSTDTAYQLMVSACWIALWAWFNLHLLRSLSLFA